MAAAAGCLEMTGPEAGMEYNQVADPAYTPADIARWPAAAFVFAQDTCKSAEFYESLSQCTHIEAEEGDIVSVVAMESMENIGYTAVLPGDCASAYMLMSEDGSPVVPRTWGSVTKVTEGQTAIVQLLRPLTSEIVLFTENTPDDFIQATLEVEGLSNAVTLSTGRETVTSPGRDGAVTTSGEETTAYFLPPSETEGIWTPELRIEIGGETLSTEIEIEKKDLVRAHIRIGLDFAKITSDGTIDVTVTSKSIINPKSEKTSRKTIQTSLSEFRSGNIHYTVDVMRDGKWKAEKVYDALCSNADKHSQIWNDWANKKALRDTMSYCLIDTEFPARIRVRKHTGAAATAEIRPSTYGIEAIDCGNNIIEFTLPEEAQGKVSVEFGGDRQHNIFIYARKPDTQKPAAGTANVRYYGPGEHHPGTIWLKDGQTLYIDHGAKVYANVKTNGSNITIAGHGILSGEKMTHHGDNLYSWGDFLVECNTYRSYVKNLTVRDITMIDSPGWNLIIPQTDGVTIDGVNMISWELNGDGIDIVSSRDVEIKNCFIRSYDDCITIKCRFIVNPITDVSNVRISNCLIWADFARGIVVGPEAGNLKNSGYIHDITVKDCIFLQHKKGDSDDLRAAFAIGQGSDGQTALWSGDNPPRTISGVTATGLTFDNIDSKGRHTAIWQYGNSPVTMQDITLSDFRIIDSKGNRYPVMYIKTNGSNISNMKVSNFTVNGKKVTSSSGDIVTDKPANVAITIQ